MMLFKYFVWRILIGVSRSALMASSAARLAPLLSIVTVSGSDRFLEIPPGRGRVTMGTQQEIDRVACLVDGAVQIFPLPLDLDVRFIYPPPLAPWALPPPNRFLHSRHQ